MKEDHPYNNTTFYGASKIADEHMAVAYHHRYGLAHNGLRYMNVYGPRQDYKGQYIAVIMKILDRIDKGLSPVIYGDGSQSYDFIYVQDIARANIACLKAETTNEFYNVGTGISTSILELCKQVLSICKCDLPIQFEPQGQTFVNNRIGSTEKLFAHTQFEPDTALEEGLKKLIEWRSAHKAEVEFRQKVLIGK